MPLTSMDRNVSSLELAALKVTALATARLMRRDLREEFDRLSALNAGPARWRIAIALGALFACAIVAAWFGWIGLLIYFAAVVAVFR